MDKLLTIELTRSEKDLLLNDLDIEPGVSGKLKLLAQRGNAITVKLTGDQVAKMVNALEEAAGRADDRELQKAYRDLVSKLERLARSG